MLFSIIMQVQSLFFLLFFTALLISLRKKKLWKFIQHKYTSETETTFYNQSYKHIQNSFAFRLQSCREQMQFFLQHLQSFDSLMTLCLHLLFFFVGPFSFSRFIIMSICCCSFIFNTYTHCTIVTHAPRTLRLTYTRQHKHSLLQLLFSKHFIIFVLCISVAQPGLPFFFFFPQFLLHAFAFCVLFLFCMPFFAHLIIYDRQKCLCK